MRNTLLFFLITHHQADEQKSIITHPLLEYHQLKDICPLLQRPKIHHAHVIGPFSSLADKILPSITAQQSKILHEAQKREPACYLFPCHPPAVAGSSPKSMDNEEISPEHGFLGNIWIYIVSIIHKNQDVFLHYFLFYCFSCLLIKLVFFLYLVHRQTKLLHRRTSRTYTPGWETEEECPYCCCHCRYKWNSRLKFETTTTNFAAQK